MLPWERTLARYFPLDKSERLRQVQQRRFGRLRAVPYLDSERELTGGLRFPPLLCGTYRSRRSILALGVSSAGYLFAIISFGCW
jgi:hypothetical protein